MEGESELRGRTETRRQGNAKCKTSSAKGKMSLRLIAFIFPFGSDLDDTHALDAGRLRLKDGHIVVPDRDFLSRDRYVTEEVDNDAADGVGL